MKYEGWDEDYLCSCSHAAHNPGENKDSFPHRTLVYVQANPLSTHWGSSVKSAFHCCGSLVAPCERRKPFSHLLSRWWRNQSDLIQRADSWWSPVRGPQTLEWVVLECTLGLSEMMLELLQNPHETETLQLKNISQASFQTGDLFKSVVTQHSHTRRQNGAVVRSRACLFWFCVLKKYVKLQSVLQDPLMHVYDCVTWTEADVLAHAGVQRLVRNLTCVLFPCLPLIRRNMKLTGYWHTPVCTHADVRGCIQCRLRKPLNLGVEAPSSA